MNDLLLNDDYLSLEYLASEGVLMETWYGFIDYARFVTVTPLLKSAIAQHRAQGGLCDTGRLKMISPEMEDYLLHEKLKQLAKADLSYYAIVLKPEQYARLLAGSPSLLDRRINRGHTGPGLEVRCFDSVRMAGAWLKTKIEVGEQLANAA
jgi:hypothetical protein